MLPKTGDVLHLDRSASVQFIARPILVRLIRIHDWQTCEGWAWLDCYELDAAGDATERRSLFVQLAGLKPGFLPRTSRVVPKARNTPHTAATKATK